MNSQRAVFGFWLFSLVFLLTSCKKDTIRQPEAKDVEPCISGPDETETSAGNSFTWCGQNADEVEWSMNGGPVVFTGSIFTPSFTVKGKNVITARGKNTHSAKAISKDIYYGKQSKIVCRIATSTPIAGNPKKFRAYLYNQYQDWVTDAVKGEHSLVIDSVDCRDTSNLGAYTHIAFFKNSYATGSRKFISVEYMDATKPAIKESNWYDCYYRKEGFVEIRNLDFKNDTCSTFTELYSKLMLRVKWKLTAVDTGFGGNTAVNCMSDDYLRFYADGTWNYFTGEYLCSDNEPQSSGVFVTLPFINNSGVSIVQAREGPLKARIPYAWEMNAWFESKFYLTPKGYYLFVPDW